MQRGTSKKGVSLEDTRRRREDKTIAVRKEKQAESLAKRRQAWAEEGADSVAAPGASSDAASATGAADSSRMYTLADIPEMMQSMRAEGDSTRQLNALRGFRRLLSVEKNPPVQQCIDCGALPLFVHFLQRSDVTQLQFEAAWALTNIASTDRTRVIVESMAVPYLAQLLNSAEADIREQAAWCLGNVAGDGSELRDVVLSAGAMPYLLANIQQPASISLLRNCVWTLSNFCRGKPAPPLAAVQPALAVLARVLTTCTDEDTVVDATWAFSYLSDGENDRIQAVVDQGIVPTLVAMLHSPKHTVVTPALRALGNIVSGNDSHTQAVVDAAVLDAIVPLLGNPRKTIRKEACWMLSNVAAGTEAQLQRAMATPGLLPKVLEQMGAAAEWDVRKEAAWVVSNMATGGKEREVAALVQAGAVRPLCDLFDTGDVRVITIALEAVEVLLKHFGNGANGTLPASLDVPQLMEECDGISKLEQLQEHENENIYNKAVRLIEVYFSDDDGAAAESENLAPQIASNGTFSFGFPGAAAGANGVAAFGGGGESKAVSGAPVAAPGAGGFSASFGFGAPQQAGPAPTFGAAFGQSFTQSF